jgi:hypothetical protein
MSATNDEPNMLVNHAGDGYAVFRERDFHKRAHLWRVERGNIFHSIGTFHDDDEALAFLRWLRERVGAR